MRAVSRLVCGLGVFLGIGFGSPAAAQTTYSWTYAGTDWSAAANWSPAGVPTAADTALFDHATTTTTTGVSLSGPAVAGRLVFAGPGRTSAGGLLFQGNGNTLTVGTGGAMTAPPMISRGAGGVGLVNFDNLQLGVAAGTTFAAGSSAANAGAVEVGYFSNWFLRNGTAFRLSDAAGTANYSLTITGGNLRLFPNTANAPQLTNGLGNAAPPGAIQFQGGGTLGAQAVNTSGAASVTTPYAMNGLVLGAGAATVEAFVGVNTSGQSGTSSVQLTFGDGSAQSGLTRLATGGAAYGTVAFQSNNTAFGAAGTRSRVFLAPGPAGIPTQNGVITEGTTAATNSPFAIVVNGFTPTAGAGGFTGRFAGYDAAAGVTAAPTTARTAATFNAITPTENALYAPSSGTATLTTNLSPQTLVIEPTGNNLTLDLNGFALNTNGLMLSGQIAGGGTGAFTITGGSLGGVGGAARNIFVTHGSAVGDATLNVASNLAATTGAVVKSGGGILALTGTTDQVNFAANTAVVVNAGILRVTPANFGPNNNLRLRGGVFEVDTQNVTTFTRTLGLGAGQVSWAGGAVTPDRGSGGFSALSGPLIVNIGGDGRTLTWNGSTGGDEFFVRSGNGLLLGSLRSGGTIIWVNGLALDGGTAGPVENRVINVSTRTVTGNPDPNAKARITGVISGSDSTNLVKLGSAGGWLELTAANTYAGNTYIESGLFQVSNPSGSATGTGSVLVTGQGSSAVVLLGNGTIAPAAGKGVTFNPFGVLLPDTGAAATPNPTVLTIGSAGTNNPVTFRQGSIFTSTANGTVLEPGNVQYSRFVFKGTGSLALETPTLNMTFATGFNPSPTDVLGVIDNQTANAIVGAFNGIAQNGQTTLGGWTFRVSYTGDITAGGVSISGGNDVVLYNFTPVPEPATVLGVCALATGAVGLVRRRTAISRRREQE